MREDVIHLFALISIEIHNKYIRIRVFFSPLFDVKTDMIEIEKSIFK